MIGAGGGGTAGFSPPPVPIASLRTQRDNLRVGRHDGVASVIESLKGHPLFGHITLTRSERSAIAALVTEMLEGNELA